MYIILYVVSHASSVTSLKGTSLFPPAKILKHLTNFMTKSKWYVQGRFQSWRNIFSLSGLIRTLCAAIILPFLFWPTEFLLDLFLILLLKFLTAFSMVPRHRKLYFDSAW